MEARCICKEKDDRTGICVRQQGKRQRDGLEENMSYKIFGDSCLDLTEELKKDPRFEMIPLTLQVDDHMVIDDETFDQKAFIKMVKESPNCPKTAFIF